MRQLRYNGKYNYYPSGFTFKEIFSDDKGSLLETLQGERVFWSKVNVEVMLEEYKEPVVEKTLQKVVAYSGAVFTVGIRYNGIGIIGEVEFTTTDGKLTDVRIVT